MIVDIIQRNGRSHDVQQALIVTLRLALPVYPGKVLLGIEKGNDQTTHRSLHQQILVRMQFFLRYSYSDLKFHNEWGNRAQINLKSD